MEEFCENNSYRVYLFLGSCFRFIFREVFKSRCLSFSEYLPCHRLDSVCSGGGTKLFDSFANFSSWPPLWFSCFCPKGLKAFRFFVVGSLSYFLKTALHRQIAFFAVIVKQRSSVFVWSWGFCYGFVCYWDEGFGEVFCLVNDVKVFEQFLFTHCFKNMPVCFVYFPMKEVVNFRV